MTKFRLIILGFVLLVGALLSTVSCQERGPSRARTGGTRQAAGSAQKDSDVLIDAIVRGLNSLPSEVAIELRPPENILDDSKSLDGDEVLATCNVTPNVPGSPFNYLEVPKGNAGFRSLRVQPGDIVRYFVKYETEDEEYGVQQLTYIELIVRRLYEKNRQNALIIEGGLNGPMPYPSRIEIWRLSDKRMNEINRRLKDYAMKPKKMVAWEPSPDESALNLLRDRLNQWFRNLPESDDSWEPDKLLSTLPSKYLESQAISSDLTFAGLQNGNFGDNDPRLLQQAIWHRDISEWAKGESLEELDNAKTLFDWTIRNIQIVDPRVSVMVHHPWQALMYGEGTAAHRAWVFAELCRQQQLDVVMLSFASSADGKVKRLLPALLLQGKLYLFDAELGLPLPGEVEGSVATLSEVIGNPELLKKLDLDEEQTYPLQQEDLQYVGAQLISSPLQLSRRASALQAELAGENYVILTANNGRLQEELNGKEQIQKITLWTQPYQAMLDELSMTEVERYQARARILVFAQRPRLWKARVLQFQGTKEIPSNQRNDPLAEPDRGHAKATELYVSPRIRPSDRVLKKLSIDKQAIYGRAKVDAGYWLGLLRYDLGDSQVAISWLKEMTLDAYPNGPWTPGARYNLARAYEATGELERAIEMLELDTSPQRYGNAIRARRLKEQLAQSNSDSEE